MKAQEVKKFPWLPVVVGAVVVVIVLAVVGYLAFKPKAKPPVAQAVTVQAEAETLLAQDDTTVTTNVGAVAVAQDNCCGIQWSGGKQLFFQGKAPGDSVSMTFTVPKDASYVFEAVHTTSTDYANTRFMIDGAPVGSVFFGFSQPAKITDWITEGTVRLTAGPHRLTLYIIGKNQGTNLFYAGIDRIKFTEVAP